DLRKIRGYGGFSEESLSVNVVPSLIVSKKNNHSIVQNIKDSFKNLVKAWVTLSSWSPNFIDYWQANFDLMPPGLQNYLFTELGVLINNPPPAWGVNA
ncbi:hypothetical protein, partial [Salmonella enterica]|uniref:hypothetical protein n=2 Tax=Enterobacteriaceae TaxID=543 RepID=UPI003D2DBF41